MLPHEMELETKLNSYLYLFLNILLKATYSTFKFGLNKLFGKETRHFKNTSRPVLCTGEFKISQLNEINFLGLTVDRNLSWNRHFHKVQTEIASGKFALSKLRHLCNTDTLKMVYFSYIHSKISFWYIPIWCNQLKKSSINSKTPKICNQDNSKYK